MHGWVLKEIIAAPNKHKTPLSEHEKQSWITCAQSLKADKTTDQLPSELQHFDAGKKEGLIFPSPKFTSFMQMTEHNFKDFSSEEQFQIFGKGLTGIIKL